jgi:hypothetical protein
MESKQPGTESTLSHTNQIMNLPSYLFKIHFNIVILSLCTYSKNPMNQICELVRRQGKLNANHQLHLF